MIERFLARFPPNLPDRKRPNCDHLALMYSDAMKKGHGLKRALQPLARDQLEGMATGALLARLKRLRWCDESRESSDLTDEEVAAAANLIIFKTDPSWNAAYADVRDVLGTREHVAGKP